MNTTLIQGTFVLLSLLVFPAVVFAAEASMEISPSSGTYKVYDDVTLRVLVSSDGQLVSAVEGRLSYNPKELTVTHVNKENTLITSWTQEPFVDDELGEIVFGGALATSSKLNATTVLTLRVRPERVGEVRMRFEGGAAIISADGLGSNVLTSFKSGKYRINPEELTEESEGNISPAEREIVTAPEVVGGQVLGAATGTITKTISSPSHPNQDSWYNASTSVFIFNYVAPSTSMRLSFDKKPNGRADKKYDEVIAEKKIDNLEDGKWYLHAAFEVSKTETINEQYRIQVDRTPPARFSITEIEGREETNPNVLIGVTATDTLSGVAYYTFSVDGADPLRWEDAGTHQFAYRAITAGVHTLVAHAYDHAGNSTSKDITFTVGLLSPPTLKLERTSFKEGEELSLILQTLPSATVDVMLQHNDEPTTIERIIVNEEGTKVYLHAEKLRAGTYTISGVTRDAHGGVSSSAELQTIAVSPSFMGMLSRHPFVPFAFIGLILLAVFAHRVYRRLPTDGEPEERVHVSPEGDTLRPEEKSVATAFSQNGQIVLTQRVKN